MQAITITNPRDGEQLVVNCEIKQAAELCAKSNNEFAQDLAKQFYQGRQLSQAQTFWLFKLSQAQQPQREIKLQSNLKNFIGNKMIQFKLPNHGKVKLYPNGKVYCGDYFYGMIEHNNMSQDVFIPSKYCHDIVIAELMLMSCDPVEWATRFGKETGICVFCGLQLTDERSVNVGYGPICAGKRGLPW